MKILTIMTLFTISVQALNIGFLGKKCNFIDVCMKAINDKISEQKNNGKTASLSRGLEEKIEESVRKVFTQMDFIPKLNATIKEVFDNDAKGLVDYILSDPVARKKLKPAIDNLLAAKVKEAKEHKRKAKGIMENIKAGWVLAKINATKKICSTGPGLTFGVTLAKVFGAKGKIEGKLNGLRDQMTNFLKFVERDQALLQVEDASLTSLSDAWTKPSAAKSAQRKTFCEATATFEANVKKQNAAHQTFTPKPAREKGLFAEISSYFDWGYKAIFESSKAPIESPKAPMESPMKPLSQEPCSYKVKSPKPECRSRSCKITFTCKPSLFKTVLKDLMDDHTCKRRRLYEMERLLAAINEANRK